MHRLRAGRLMAMRRVVEIVARHNIEANDMEFGSSRQRERFRPRPFHEDASTRRETVDGPAYELNRLIDVLDKICSKHRIELPTTEIRLHVRPCAQLVSVVTVEHAPALDSKGKHCQI